MTDTLQQRLRDLADTASSVDGDAIVWGALLQAAAVLDALRRVREEE